MSTPTGYHEVMRDGKVIGYAPDKEDYAIDEILLPEQLLLGCRVQVDRSGVGHCWCDISAEELPGDAREEIEGEIIDGGREEGEITSGGLRYRWF